MRVYPQQLQLCLATQHRSVQGSNNAAHSAVDIYKPPGVVSQLFCQQFSHMLDQLISAKHQFIIYDDFNCPEVGSNQLDVILEDLQERSYLMQHVYATCSNNTLDLRMTPVSNNGMLRWSSDMPQQPSSCRLSSARATSPADHLTLQLL